MSIWVDTTVPAPTELYITDLGSHAIRRLSLTTGVVTTVGGTLGVPGFDGDGGPATSALLFLPTCAVLHPSTLDLYICDTRNHVVRKVSASDKIITTVAGIGTSAGYTGDRILATNSQLNYPQLVVFSPQVPDAFFILDRFNSRVRLVYRGVISTYAGTGLIGYSGDGGPATLAKMYRPLGIAVDATGNLYIGDSSNDVSVRTPCPSSRCRVCCC